MPEVGEIKAFAFPIPGGAVTKAILNGWIPCDGRTLPGEKFPELIEAIEQSWGGNPQTNEFAIPDLRGSFIRGVSYGNSFLDPEAQDRAAPRPDLPFPGQEKLNVGSFQKDAIKSHDHKGGGMISQGVAFGNGLVRVDVIGGTKQYDFSVRANEGGKSETRPANHSILFMIYSGRKAGDPTLQEISDDINKLFA